jgi:hypothetical protein
MEPLSLDRMCEKLWTLPKAKAVELPEDESDQPRFVLGQVRA